MSFKVIYTKKLQLNLKTNTPENKSRMSFVRKNVERINLLHIFNNVSPKDF